VNWLKTRNSPGSGGLRMAWSVLAGSYGDALTMATPEYAALIAGARVAGATVAARLAEQGPESVAG
jgi:hypothetical protein